MSVVIRRSTGLPLPEASLFVGIEHRGRSNAADTIHMVARTVAFLHGTLDELGIDIDARLKTAHFLSATELHFLAEAVRHRIDDGDAAPSVRSKPKVAPSRIVSLERVRMRRSAKKETPAIKNSTVATRMRHMERYLAFRVDYACHGMPRGTAEDLKGSAADRLKEFLALKPKERRRTRLGARQGIDEIAETNLIDAIQIDSATNPWKSEFVRKRNRLIVLMCLGLGIRRGELLGIQINDLGGTTSTVQIIRRADSPLDSRRHQPNTKTYDREIEVHPGLMAEIRQFINKDRYAIKAARRHSYLIVSEDGTALSLDSVNKMFAGLRKSCPKLPKKLSAHVLRHTWNDRFSEAAEKMGLSHAAEEKARANQQGWSETSAMSATYTRRYTKKKGKEVELRLQAALEEKVRGTNN